MILVMVGCRFNVRCSMVLASLPPRRFRDHPAVGLQYSRLMFVGLQSDVVHEGMKKTIQNEKKSYEVLSALAVVECQNLYCRMYKSQTLVWGAIYTLSIPMPTSKIPTAFQADIDRMLGVNARGCGLLLVRTVDCEFQVTVGEFRTYTQAYAEPFSRTRQWGTSSPHQLTCLCRTLPKLKVHKILSQP
ncbi:hypothetical protein R1flu_002009 [Riccia fluitans]|uniref:Uncharacterized protein n=1 Tax=Riccia fluitans TaxID=41844 RepID=A0ABD1Y5X1_9MARC